MERIPLPKPPLTTAFASELCAALPVSANLQRQILLEMEQRIPNQEVLAFAIEQVQCAPAIGIFSWRERDYITAMSGVTITKVLAIYQDLAHAVLVGEQLALELLHTPAGTRIEFYGSYQDAINAITRCYCGRLEYPTECLVSDFCSNHVNLYTCSTGCRLKITRSGAKEIYSLDFCNGTRAVVMATPGENCATMTWTHHDVIAYCKIDHYLRMVSAIIGREITGYRVPSCTEYPIAISTDRVAWQNAINTMQELYYLIGDQMTAVAALV